MVCTLGYVEECRFTRKFGIYLVRLWGLSCSNYWRMLPCFTALLGISSPGLSFWQRKIVSWQSEIVRTRLWASDARQDEIVSKQCETRRDCEQATQDETRLWARRETKRDCEQATRDETRLWASDATLWAQHLPSFPRLLSTLLAVCTPSARQHLWICDNSQFMLRIDCTLSWNGFAWKFQAPR